MTNAKNTKRALLMSVLSMMLCCAMLVGSTFAWFTDSVTSGKNKIVAGNLDVELEYSLTGETDSWLPVNENTNLFKPADETLWEPGHTEYVYLRIHNAGTLALKYQFDINVFGDEAGGAEKEYTNVNNEKFKLSEHLVFNQLEGIAPAASREALWLASAEAEKAKMGDLSSLGLKSEKLLPDEETLLTLAVYMPTQVGNEANQLTSARETEGEPTIYLGLNLMATQTPHENDSFGNDYDANIQFPLTDANGASYTAASTSDGKIIFTSKDANAVKFTADPATKEMTLTNGKNYSGDIKIPSTVTDGAGNVYTLTAIDDNAFHGNASLTSVVIPDSVVDIGKDAFEGCSSLESLIVPNSNIKMRNYCFQGCESLEYIVLSDFYSRERVITNPRTGAIIKVYPEARQTEMNAADFMNCKALNSIFYWSTTCDMILGSKQFNDAYLNAKIYVYSENEPEETTKPNSVIYTNKIPADHSEYESISKEYWYWHMVDGVPTPWSEPAGN